MEIRRLKLTGFKSFVEPTELRIEPGLTGIVGPNGCGKSNLLEAIRWVMGESSAKSMRGGGMDDVIFAGTTTRPQRDFAEVTLVAMKEQGELFPSVEPGPDGELEVVRRIERGAGSAYRANGRDVRAKDIALIFADAATGPHSPALVSQGKIAAVISAKPAERRAMLEEAAGIAGLHVRRKDAEQKLRASEANLARLDDILADMDNRAASLRRQARAAERYTELTTRILLAEGKALFARYTEASAAAEQAAAAAQTGEENVRIAQETQLAAAAITQAAIEALATKRAAASSAREAASEARHRLDRLSSERDGIVRRIADLTAQIAQIATDEGREDELSRDATQAIQRLGEEEVAVARRIKDAKASRPDFAGRITEADRAVSEAEVALAQAMARLASEQAERRVTEAALAAARQRLGRATDEQQRIAAALASLPDAAPLAQQQANAATQQAEALAARETADARIAAAEQQRASLTEAVSEQQRTLASARATLAALESEAQALTKATQASGSGERILDQITVTPGYERALAAALGDDLEAGTAEQGRMRWIGALIGDKDPVLPAGCDALAAKVTAPKQLARRLAQVAVAKTDEGAALAVGQRLVTLDGRMRRWDGFVIEEGGAATAERLIRLNRLEAIAKERPALADAVQSADTTLAASQQALREAGEEERAARTASSAAQDAVRTAERVLGDVAAQIERVGERRADLDRRAAEIDADLAVARKEADEAEAAQNALPASDAANADVTLRRQASEEHRAAVSRLQAEQAMTDRAIAADEERLRSVKAEAEGWRARAGDAARRIADMRRRAETLAADLERLSGRPEALATELETLLAGTRDLDAASETARIAEREAEAHLAEAEKAIAAANEALSATREARAGAAARAEHAVARRREIGQACGERFECPPPVLPGKLGFADTDVRDAATEQATHDRLVLERERLGPVNLVAATELAELEETQAKSRSESEELTTAIHQLRGSIGHLNREGRTRLLAAFEAVNGHFQRLFTTLFQGGSARLELIESDDPLEAGLEILAQPPGKKLTTLTLLSGGEQALTAIALIFGLFLTNPAPICVLDEVDAPLDDANIERFCDLLDRMVDDTNTRYLIVTHNAVTMSRMHRLFGVTMAEHGISRLVSVDLGAAERLIAAE